MPVSQCLPLCGPGLAVPLPASSNPLKPPPTMCPDKALGVLFDPNEHEAAFLLMLEVFLDILLNSMSHRSNDCNLETVDQSPLVFGPRTVSSHVQHAILAQSTASFADPALGTGSLLQLCR